MKISETLRQYLIYHKDVVLPTEKYYVYEYINPLNSKVFYVGAAKGNSLRAYEFTKHRSEAWKNEVKSFGGIVNIEIRIVKYFDDPIEAQKFEFQYIKYLKLNNEAYCCHEGDDIRTKKYPKLQYYLYLNDMCLVFNNKSDLYIYCKEKFGISKNIVRILIDSSSEYRGVQIKAHNIRIVKKGKEHL